MTIDFSKYKFRASGLGNLMVNSRTKSDSLSETTKSYLQECWIKEVYTREKLDIVSKYMDKGVACEPDSLDLVQKSTKQTLFKNQKEFNNDFITGHPDSVKSDKIIEIKTSWDIWTFMKVDLKTATKDYYYQVLGYMWLTKTVSAELYYCLTNTPEELIADELYRASFRKPELGETDEATDKFRHNYIFDDIPVKDRVKKFEYEFNPLDIIELEKRIVNAREYMKGLSL